MEAQWGLQDGDWGRQVVVGGPPKVSVLGHFALGMAILGVPTCPLDNPLAPDSLVAP